VIKRIVSRTDDVLGTRRVAVGGGSEDAAGHVGAAEETASGSAEDLVVVVAVEYFLW